MKEISINLVDISQAVDKVGAGGQLQHHFFYFIGNFSNREK